MTEWSILKNAPIKEAVVQLRFSSDHVLKDDELEAWRSELSTEYPKEQKRYNFSIEAKIDNSQDRPKQESSLGGYRLSDEEGVDVILLSKENITVVRKRPYIKWDDLKSKLKDALLKNELTECKRYQRVGLRYINEIEFEPKIEDTWGDYFKIGPNFPSSISQQFEAFSLHLVVPDKEHKFKGIINLVFQPIAQSADIRIILDIDVIYDSPNVELEKAQEQLEEMRGFKNQIFFSSLTNKMIDKFN